MADDLVNGWSFPEWVEVSEDHAGWYRSERGGVEQWNMGHDILLDAAHQSGLESIETELAHVGTGLNDVPYVAVKAVVEIDGCPSVNALGSIDETGNSLEDMVSTAETKAINRCMKRAMGITRRGDGGDTTTTSQGGQIERTDDGGVEVTPPETESGSSDW